MFLHLVLAASAWASQMASCRRLGSLSMQRVVHLAGSSSTLPTSRGSTSCRSRSWDGEAVCRFAVNETLPCRTAATFGVREQHERPSSEELATASLVYHVDSCLD